MNVFRNVMLGAVIASSMAVFAPSPAQAQDVTVSWVQVGGPFRVGGKPVGPPDAPLCAHGLNCSCPGQGDFCGSFQNGVEVKYWNRGCNNPPITIQCIVTKRAAAAPAQQAAPPQPAAPQVAQAPAAGPFDKPVSVQKLPKKPGSDVEVSCTYYPDIMVRETTDGPTSTDAAIVRGARPPCSAGKVAGEIAAKTADHSLLGRKGPFLVFSFMDPHGAVPFVVVDSGSGRVVFSDATVGNPEIRGAAIESDALRLRYRRGVNADCSIMKDARGCWAKLVKAGNIPAAMAQQVPSPRICDAAYKKTKATPDNTSIVIYDTEMRIDAKGTAQVLTSGPVACDAQP